MNSVTDEFKIFLEYYKSRKGIDLMESPSHSGKRYPQTIDDSDVNLELAKEIIWSRKPVEELKILNTSLRCYRDVYDNNKDEDHWITRDNYIAARFNYTSKDKGIKMLGVWQNREVSGTAREIVFQYYLPKYKFIESDNVHTTQGRGYWYKLIYKANNTNRRVTAIDCDTNTEMDIMLLPEKEHNEAYGNNSNIVFRIYK